VEEFEALLGACRGALERFVYFQMPVKSDADDVLQEICLLAYRKFDTLKDKGAFQAWLFSIARNQCKEYFRQRAKKLELPLDAISETVLAYSRYGVTETFAVGETLEKLGGKDKQILYLFYFRQLPQADIAKRLGVPLGTVKSRLYTAKQHFKEAYPYQPKVKGETNMKKLPEFMPEYKIEPRDQEPLFVKWEELMGWFLVPKLGEKLCWGMYDIPSRKCYHWYEMQVTGRAEVHGIQGVELLAKEVDCSGKNETTDRTFVAQLTDTHCRYLSETHLENGVKKYYTFLDGDSFLDNWGFGENNCGNEIHIAPKGDIERKGSVVTAAEKRYLLDVVGRYTVTIGGKVYDTICVMDIETYNTGVVSEQYLDQNGRTILWRRFNRDDWAFDRYKQKWSEKLPNNERLLVNGETYVHWYDCITDYIL